jgi:hypothetical protein
MTSEPAAAVYADDFDAICKRFAIHLISELVGAIFDAP